MRLGKTEITCLQAIGEKDIQERYHRIYLRIGIRATGIEELKAHQADAKIEEAAYDTRNAIPYCLTS